ncbi:MAG: hypothetical protein K9N51_09595, partial [Candidatus Pacebacteria bacterium]|nr:hypothetical protein [Candidatus Paceibacterota bacterium]
RGENANAALLLDGLLGVVSHGRGRLVLFQLTEEALRDTTAVRAADPVTEPALTEAWHLKNRARSCWQANRARALLLANLGLSSSDELLDGFFAPRRPLPFQAIDKWTYLGPLPPPATDDADPVELDLDAILDDREADKQFQLADGRQLSWYVPTDVNNGLGMGGYMNLAPVYGVKPRQRTVAVTHIWSSEARRATLQLGADWWFRVAVNGAEVFRTGTIKGFHGATFSQGFAFTVRADLKEGWNEIVCVLGSGSNGNGFWFQVSDPGDVYVEPSLAKPTQKPWLFLRFARGPGTRRLTGQELADAEEAEPNFSLYSEPLSVHDDPYLYMFW